MGGEGVEWQTEVASKLVDKGKEEVYNGRRKWYLTKRKFPSTADGSTSRRMESKIKDYSKSSNLCLYMAVIS